MEFDRDKRIVMRDIRAVMQCSPGARLFFKQHNLNWSDFLKNGIDCGSIIDTDDEMGLVVVRYVHGW